MLPSARCTVGNFCAGRVRPQVPAHLCLDFSFFGVQVGIGVRGSLVGVVSDAFFVGGTFPSWGLAYRLAMARHWHVTAVDQVAKCICSPYFGDCVPVGDTGIEPVTPAV